MRGKIRARAADAAAPDVKTAAMASHMKTAAVEAAAEMGMTATAAAGKVTTAAMTAATVTAEPLTGCERGRRKSGRRDQGKCHGLDLRVHDASLKACLA